MPDVFDTITATPKKDIFDTVDFQPAITPPTPQPAPITKPLPFGAAQKTTPFTKPTTKPLGLAVKHGYQRGGVMMVKQLAGLSKIIGENLGIDRAKEWSDMMLMGVDEYYKTHPEEAIQIAPNLGYKETLKQFIFKPQNLVQGLVESSPLMLEGILGTMTGGTALGITFMGTPIAGEVYADARKEGTEPLPALAQSILTGAGEATIEQWTLGRKLGLLRGFRQIVKGGLPKIMWEGTKAFFRGTAEEGSQEFNRNFWQWVFTDRSQDWFQNAEESMAAGGPMETVMAGLFTTAGAVGPMVGQQEKLSRVQKIQAAINENPNFSPENKAEINTELNEVTRRVREGEFEPAPEKAPTAPPVAKAKPEGVKPPKPTPAKPVPVVAPVAEGKVAREWQTYLKDIDKSNPKVQSIIKQADIAFGQRDIPELSRLRRQAKELAERAGENTGLYMVIRALEGDVLAETTPTPSAEKPAKEPWEMTRGELVEVDYAKFRPERIEQIRTGLAQLEEKLAAFSPQKKKGRAALEFQIKDAKERLVAFDETEGKQKIGEIKAFHREQVQNALKQGKPVPPEVLQEYKSEKWAQEALKGKAVKPIPKGKIPISTEAQKSVQITKLRSSIHALAAKKGLAEKTYRDIFKKYGGARHLAAARKPMTLEQLQAVYKAIEKARPKKVGWRTVITQKTEKNIQSLKESLKAKLQMTDADYQVILDKETHGRIPTYQDAEHYVTETEGKAVIKRMHNEAQRIRVVQPYKEAVKKNPEVAKAVDDINKTIANKRKRKVRDPAQIESMRYYNQQAEIKTGTEMFALYEDLINTNLENHRTRTATWNHLKATIPNFKKIAKDETAQKHIEDYIASKSNLKNAPKMPVDITGGEIKLAQEIEKIFRDYRLPARAAKFFNWYYYNEPIPDYDRYKKEISKARDIYDSKGEGALIEYLKTQEWGVIHSGYSPLESVVFKTQLHKAGPKTVGKGHIKIRTDIEYKAQDRSLFQRLAAYMRQMDTLYNLSPKIDSYVQMFDDNYTKFDNPKKVQRNIESFLQNLKRYDIPGGFWERTIARMYAQAMRAIIMISPVLSFRNTFQNLAFEHDKSILFDPRNKKLTPEDVDYIETYVIQYRAMVEQYFMLGEALPGFRTINKLVDRVKIYPWSDIANRYWSFWAKINQVRRALESKTTKKMMQKARFADMTELEQRQALYILAKDGKDAMARYVARVHVDDVHFLYERSQRSPAEMGAIGRVMGNLMLFPRAYGEKLQHAAAKVTSRTANFPTRYRGLKILFMVMAGGLLAGEIYKLVTGRKRNPYNPFQVLAYHPGGLALGATITAGSIFADMVLSLGGDKKAMYRLTSSLPKAGDMFIPFYAYIMRSIEASAEMKNIDNMALRQILQLIDKEYKVRGGAYKLERNALEKWQYAIAGAGIDQTIQAREREHKAKLKRLGIKPRRRAGRGKRKRVTF